MAQSAAAAWGVFAVYGVYMAIADGNGRALLAEFSSGERRGTAFGAYHMVIGLAALPASIIAGLLYDHVSAAAPFWGRGGGRRPGCRLDAGAGARAAPYLTSAAEGGNIG